MGVVFVLFLHSNILWFGRRSPEAVVPLGGVLLLECSRQGAREFLEFFDFALDWWLESL